MKGSENPFPSVNMEEIASDGSTLANADADHRRMFLGEDGQLHVKDSAGTVTGIGSGIAESLIDAKGDLIAGSAADTAARLPIGSNTHVLTVDSTETLGMKWAAPASGAVALTYYSLQLASPLSLTGSFADVFSQSCGAGTWLLMATLTVKSTSTTPDVRAEIWDGSSTIYASGESVVSSNAWFECIAMTTVVVLGTTTTIKVSATANAGANVEAAINGPVVGASNFVAIKIA